MGYKTLNIIRSKMLPFWHLHSEINKAPCRYVYRLIIFGIFDVVMHKWRKSQLWIYFQNFAHPNCLA